MQLDEADTVGLVRVFQEPFGKCFNRNPIHGLTACNGQCNSGTTFNQLTMQQDEKCICCSVAEYEKLEVLVNCEDGSRQMTWIPTPKSCSCQACNGKNGNNNNERESAERPKVEDRPRNQDQGKRNGAGQTVDGLSFVISLADFLNRQPPNRGSSLFRRN